MNITSSIFRENDIRGTYPEQINENTIKLVAYAIARKCKKHEINSIAIGRDGRLSGPSLLESFCDGLLEAGIHVNNIGLVTSPLLYFAAKKEESKSGIMITGSHNPKNHNGIKMVIDDKPVSGTEIFDLIRNSEDFGKKVTVVDWVQAGNIIEEAALLVNTTSLGMHGKQDMRVPLDGLQKETVVTDLVYAPLRTNLLATAEAAGCVTVDGLGMLLHQAVPAFERWFGIRPTVDRATRAAALG